MVLAVISSASTIGRPAYTRVERVLAKLEAAFLMFIIPNTGNFLAIVPKNICPDIVFLYIAIKTIKAINTAIIRYHLAIIKSLNFTASTVCIGSSAPN